MTKHYKLRLKEHSTNRSAQNSRYHNTWNKDLVCYLYWIQSDSYTYSATSVKLLALCALSLTLRLGCGWCFISHVFGKLCFERLSYRRRIDYVYARSWNHPWYLSAGNVCLRRLGSKTRLTSGSHSLEWRRMGVLASTDRLFVQHLVQGNILKIEVPWILMWITFQFRASLCVMCVLDASDNNKIAKSKRSHYGIWCSGIHSMFVYIRISEGI